MGFFVDQLGCSFTEGFFKNHIPWLRLLKRNVSNFFVHSILSDLGISWLCNFLKIILGTSCDAIEENLFTAKINILLWHPKSASAIQLNLRQSFLYFICISYLALPPRVMHMRSYNCSVVKRNCSLGRYIAYPKPFPRGIIETCCIILTLSVSVFAIK